MVRYFERETRGPAAVVGSAKRLMISGRIGLIWDFLGNPCAKRDLFGLNTPYLSQEVTLKKLSTLTPNHFATCVLNLVGR